MRAKALARQAAVAVERAGPAAMRTAQPLQ
jgi:hypothetical protein